MTNTPQPRSERIEGEHHFAIRTNPYGMWAIRRKHDDKLVDSAAKMDTAESLLAERDAEASHFIEVGRQQPHQPGEDGAAGLLQKLTAAGDLLEFASDQSEAWVIFSSAKSAARNYLATQPDTPAEEVCSTCGGDGRQEKSTDGWPVGTAAVIGDCDTCHGTATRPSNQTNEEN